MKKFICSACGKQDIALFDGYSVGDRLLEGVMFEVRKNDDDSFDVQITAEHSEYFSGLNEKKWLKEIREYLPENFDQLVCPKCKGDFEEIE